ncbi:MAG: DUF5118 domain-containing protein [Gemmatimonadaceae bacterium]
MTRTSFLVASLASFSVLAGCARPKPQAPTPATTPRSTSPQTLPGGPAPGGGTPGDSSARPAANAPRPYARVITKDAKTRTGMFKTHLVGEKLYFEIPRKELNRDMLLVGRFTRATPAPGDFEGYGGDEFTERTLRWERSGNRVILRSTSFGIMADTTLAVTFTAPHRHDPVPEQVEAA